MERARELAAEPKISAVDVVFNNHYRAQAVVNALQFEHLLEGERVVAPASLVTAYPDALRGRVRPDPPVA